MFKYCAIIFLAFGVFTASEGSSIFYKRAADAYDDALKVINKLKDAINKGIFDASATFKETIHNIQNMGSNAKDDADSKITTNLNNAITQIDKLKDWADSLGVDIKSCVGNKEDTLISLSKKMIEEVNDCADTEVNSIDNRINAAEREIKGLTRIVDNLIQDLKDCGSDSGAIPCYVNIGKEAGNYLISTPSQIAEKVAETIVKAHESEPNIPRCSNDKISSFSSQSSVIVADISLCANDLIDQFFWNKLV